VNRDRPVFRSALLGLLAKARFSRRLIHVPERVSEPLKRGLVRKRARRGPICPSKDRGPDLLRDDSLKPCCAFWEERRGFVGEEDLESKVVDAEGRDVDVIYVPLFRRKE
jgi:hypothetical protein